MNAAIRTPWWLWPNLLALDAPAIALLWQTLLAHCFDVHLRFVQQSLLALTCWLIYAVDYILDGWRATKLARRHEFFRRHRTPMLLLIGLAIVLIIATIRRLHWETLKEGLLCGSLVMTYLLATHLAGGNWRARWPRELVVAMLFVGGTALSISSALGAERVFLLAPGIILAVLCWINVALIECGENDAPSVSACWLTRHLRFVSIVVVCGCVVLYSVALLPAQFAIAAGFGAGVFIWLDGKKNLSPDALRVAVDAALCTPAFVLLFWSLP